MPKFAANLSMLYTELSFLDRFKAAAEAGFTGVEYLFPMRSRRNRWRRSSGPAV
jgi:hydroxypyruvate isomerase